MIVDIHCHYVPEEYFAFVERGDAYRVSQACSSYRQRFHR